MSEPVASTPVGISIVAEPALSDAKDDVYPPPVITTLPDGVVALLPPLTVTVTASPWIAVMLKEEGVTATVGVVLDTVTIDEVPVAPR